MRSAPRAASASVSNDDQALAPLGFHESGVLHERRFAGGQVPRRAIAEPAASGLHVHALRGRALGRGFVDVVAVFFGRVGDASRIHDAPSVGLERGQVFDVAGMDVERDFELAGRAGAAGPTILRNSCALTR